MGRNPEKTEAMARSLMTAREGSRVLGIGAIDVRNADSVKGAVDQCVQELGAVDFCMYVGGHKKSLRMIRSFSSFKLKFPK